MASAFDRACELFAAIKGLVVDYGEEHAAEHQVGHCVEKVLGVVVICEGSMQGLGRTSKDKAAMRNGQPQSLCILSDTPLAGIPYACSLIC